MRASLWPAPVRASSRPAACLGVASRPNSRPAVALSARIDPTSVHQHRRRSSSVVVASSSTSTPTPKVNKTLPPAITLTPAAIKRCLELKKSKGLKPGETLYLRVGVRSGGCNGMSYTMDFTEEQKADDHVFEATAGTSESGSGENGGEESVKILCDPKSLLFLFGLQLDYSDALIGGGFSFQNPNAEGSCGCGKSFNV